MPARMERVERRAPFRTVDRRQHRESGQHVGHVLSRIELRLRPRDAVGAAIRREIRKASIAQRAPADRGAVDLVRTGVGQPLVGRSQRGTQRAADRGPRDVAHRMDRIDIGNRHLIGQECLARQRQRFGRERRIRIGIAQCGGQRLDQSLVDHRCLAASPRRRHRQQQMRRILLPGLPAHERVGVVRGEELQLRNGTPDSFTGAEKPRSSDGTGRSGTSSNAKLCSVSPNSSVRAAISRPAAVQQPHRNRNHDGCLSGWPGVGGVRCFSVSV